ncbi:hypothetical protein [Kitasatospora herbaricolor]|uniref:hypothetical protein n=1 Tax=Kitasatospora herbaricolor TaxID=68217 RepID=UPI0036DAADA9
MPPTIAAVTKDRTEHITDVREPESALAELRLAWQRAKALWSSDPTDPDAYAAFIQAGTALYRSPPPTGAEPSLRLAPQDADKRVPRLAARPLHDVPHPAARRPLHGLPDRLPIVLRPILAAWPRAADPPAVP